MMRRRRRRGYAMVMVVLFITLLLGMWGVATRQIGAMLRIEQARARRVKRDSDALPAKKALAVALAALEVGYPPSSYSDPHRLQTSDGALFAVTFARDPILTDEWILSVFPTDDVALPPLDSSQFTPNPP